MIDISKHITMKDATYSKTAVEHGIKNEPGVAEIKAMQHLAQSVIEPLISFFKQIVKINSFFRCARLNIMIGGAQTSQHTKGEAIDIEGTNGITNAQLFHHIKSNLPFDQLIWEFGTDTEPAWVHVSLKKANNRYVVLKSVKENGRTKYIKYPEKT